MDVKTLCLAVLSDGDASGYEIRKQVAEGPFSLFYDAGYGSIYPALNKLSEEGHVTCEQREQEKRPDKKVYALTGKGRLALLDALAKEPAPDKLRSEFLLLMYFAPLLSARQVDELVDQRCAALRERIEDMEAHCVKSHESAGEKFVCGFGLAMSRAALAYLEDNRHELLRAALLPERQVAE